MNDGENDDDGDIPDDHQNRDDHGDDYDGADGGGWRDQERRLFRLERVGK